MRSGLAEIDLTEEGIDELTTLTEQLKSLSSISTNILSGTYLKRG